MAKVTLQTITNNIDDNNTVQKINENFDAVEAALDEFVSRDGTTPNQMDAQLDMNGYNVINVADPVTNLQAANKRYVDSKTTYTANLWEMDDTDIPAPGEPGEPVNREFLVHNGSDWEGRPIEAADLDQTLSTVNLVDWSPTPPVGGQVPTYNDISGKWTPSTNTPAAAGSDREIQYNDGGSTGAKAGFEFDEATDTLSVPIAAPTVLSIVGSVEIPSVISDTVSSWLLHDYNPTGLAGATIIRMNPTYFINLTSIVAPTTPKMLTIINVNPDWPIRIRRSTTAYGTEANRIVTASDVYIWPDESATLWYDLTSARWRILSVLEPQNGRHVFRLFDDFDSGANAAAIYREWDGYVAGTSSAVGQGFTSVPTARGILNLVTGTTSTGQASVGRQADASTAAGTGFHPGRGLMHFRMRSFINGTWDGTQGGYVRCGFGDESNGAPTHGIYLTTDPSVLGTGTQSRWHGLARDGTMNFTLTSNIVDVADNLFQVTEFVVYPDASRVDYYAEDVLVAFSDGNIPTTNAIVPQLQIAKAVGATSRTLAVDWVEINVHHPNRGTF